MRDRSATRMVLLAAGLLTTGVPARAGVPDWLRAAATVRLPEYPQDTEAVVLFSEKQVTVKDTGEITTRRRRAYKILRPPGRSHATVTVFFDQETRLTHLKGWGLAPGEKEYEVKEKDAIESTPFTGALYADMRMKVLRLPGAETGSVVGYEYEQKGRPYLLDDTWWISDEIPVRQARYVLELPAGWSFKTGWFQHDPLHPQSAGENRWVWQVENVAAIEWEPSMPDWRALAARMTSHFFPQKPEFAGKVTGSWRDLGRWYGQLAVPRRQATPEIRRKVAELAGAAPTWSERIRALTTFVQRDVRYVAIEIGIGGFQPHPAQEVFLNRYGDCKDKATLLGAMLEEIGVESYYVLVHIRRGIVQPSAPSAWTFNHVILAVRLPEEEAREGYYAVADHPTLGRLLFFDPTDVSTPLGYLPPSLQASYGLVVSNEGGELMPLPLLPPSVNRLLRQGKFTLTPTGDLEGTIQEIHQGSPAARLRRTWLAATAAERQKLLESFLSDFLSRFRLLNYEVENLEAPDQPLVIQYRFSASPYAKRVGELLLLRPRVLGEKSSELLEGKERRNPVEFDEASSESDLFEFSLPEGYQVDELPPPVETSTDLAEYRSQLGMEGNVLRYQRHYELKQVWIPTERLKELKEFFRKVASDERRQAVLRRTSVVPNQR